MQHLSSLRIWRNYVAITTSPLVIPRHITLKEMGWLNLQIQSWLESSKNCCKRTKRHGKKGSSMHCGLTGYPLKDLLPHLLPRSFIVHKPSFLLHWDFQWWSCYRRKKKKQMPVVEEMMNSSTYNRLERRPSIMPSYVKTRSKNILIEIPRYMTSN